MTRRLRWILITIAAVVGLGVLRFTLLGSKPFAIEVAPAAIGTVEDAVTNSRAGTVRSRRRSRLGAEQPGRVIEIPHREGSTVVRGDVLLRLDPTTAKIERELAERDLEAARAALVAAEAASALANQEHRRAEALHTQNLISQEVFDQATSRRDVAAGQLEAARANERRARAAIALAGDRIEDLRVVAPFDGVITQRFVEIGEAVAPGQPVLEIMSNAELYVSAPIDEIDIGRIASGLPARVTLDPYRGVTWDGVVTRVAPYLDDVLEQNRTLEIEVELVPNDSLPWPKPGTSADVEIVLARRDSVLRVPTLAVIEGRRVLVAERGRARERTVEVGLKNWEWSEIRAGLAPGDPVITNLDQKGLQAGVRVTTRGDGIGGAARAEP